MKRIVLSAALAVSSSLTLAEAPGGPGCGWGNLLFEGQSGLPSHLVASLTNGTTGNATFGMTSGTNGCDTSGTLTYAGKSMINIGALLDEFSEDVARGEGEVLSAVAVSLGVVQEDRAHFRQVMHENFNKLFPSAEVTTEDVLASMWDVMANDKQLAKYAS